MNTAKIVVGGGIAGILSAILLKKKQPQDRVLLIESEPECGGLLRSIVDDKGNEFDYGTHIVGDTGIKELDSILQKDIDENWYRLPILKPGNYLHGHFHKYSQLMYAAALPKETLAQATYELLSADHAQAKLAANQLDYCLTTYGKTFTDQLFAPLLNKLFGAPLETLHKDAHRLFGYDRIILGPAHMMRELKHSPHLNDILAFESYNEGVSSALNYYPKQGKGVGLWVEDLVGQAADLGVEVHTSTQVTGIKTDNKKVCQLVTEQLGAIDCDELIWTIPLFPLIKLTKLSFTPNYRPTIRKMRLHHFIFDRPFDTHNFHVYCNDPDMESFRITLYPNIAKDGEQNGKYRCTVEVLSEHLDNIEQHEAAILAELKTMGVVNSEAQVISQFTTLITNGFPVYTNEFVDELKRQRDCVSEQLDNVRLLGKASANNFFMADVLAEVFHDIKDK